MKPFSGGRFHRRCRLLLVLLLTCLAVLPVWAEPGSGDPAPRWSLRDRDGDLLRFPRGIDADYSIVLFWASWCPYCKALMPRLSALQQEIGADRLPVLAMRLEEPEGGSSQAAGPDGFRVFESAWDVAEDYGVSVLPGLFLVRDGRIVYRLDYPPSDHPSQKITHGPEQAALLGEWWEGRLRSQLHNEGLRTDSG